MIHQRQFMSALLHRASSPAVWLNPWRWYAIPHAAIGALTVDSDAHVGTWPGSAGRCTVRPPR